MPNPPPKYIYLTGTTINNGQGQSLAVAHHYGIKKFRWWIWDMRIELVFFTINIIVVNEVPFSNRILKFQIMNNRTFSFF